MFDSDIISLWSHLRFHCLESDTNILQNRLIRLGLVAHIIAVEVGRRRKATRSKQRQRAAGRHLPEGCRRVPS